MWRRSARLSEKTSDAQFPEDGGLELGQGHLFLGHMDEAIDFLRGARASNSRFSHISLQLAAVLGLRGDVDEARATLAELLEIKPELNSLAQMPKIPPSVTVMSGRAAMPDK
jgi:hypothetical protein